MADNSSNRNYPLPHPDHSAREDAARIRESIEKIDIDAANALAPVTSDRIADNAVIAVKIASNAVTSAKIANNAVTADKIASNAVTAAKIASNAVTTDKIANNAVTAVKINDQAVTTAKIANNAVTTDKLASKSVTLEKMQDLPANTFLGRGSSAGVPTALNRPQTWDILSQLDSNSYYVDAVNGNDTNDGTAANKAKKTIGAVLKIVYSRITFRTANITIYLAEGDYNESILIHGTVQALNAGRYIIIKGAGYDKTWVKGISGQYAICYMADIAMDFINSYAFSRFYIQDNGTIAFVNKGGSATLNAITCASAQFTANDTTTVIYSGDYADGVRVDIGQATLYSSIIFEGNPTFTNLYRVQSGTARFFWKDRFAGSFTGRKFLIEAGAEMRLTNGDRFRNWNDIIPGTIDGVVYPYYVRDGWKRSTYDNTPLGMMDEFPFRPSELPFGWYFPSGDYFPLTSNVGKQLNSLSANFKSDWGITLDGKGNIRLCDPARFFATDGAGNTVGRFPRFVDGVNQLPGSVQNDAIRNITGSATIGSAMATTDASGALTGATYHVGFTSGGLAVPAYIGVRLDASFVVPTAPENRPFTVGKTPAIFLGV